MVLKVTDDQGNAIKTTIKCHFIPVRMSNIKKTRDNKSRLGCGEKGILVHFW